MIAPKPSAGRRRANRSRGTHSSGSDYDLGLHNRPPWDTAARRGNGRGEAPFILAGARKGAARGDTFHVAGCRFRAAAASGAVDGETILSPPPSNADQGTVGHDLPGPVAGARTR
ncbi:hypothetical protein TNCT1_36110 [Streptomyces sp. 1-11]|nr:hypothetical protein TNCT1_36110 [Streptomyces sp. 1-11]